MYQKASIALAIQTCQVPVVSDVSVSPGDLKDSPTTPPSSIRIIRYYLLTLTPAALDAAAMHNELAMRAKIIKEYMGQHSISDIQHGIRQFTAFERERLHRLGMITPPKRRIYPRVPRARRAPRAGE